ncbi:MAG TPA: TIGR01777 family oxidoreductase [Candidatus Binatia bacterium]|nr:TIGR01777 family oxidoreductase [Candidatus Binatia bacterium]
MKLVITGATGFIGSALVERLRRQVHSLVLLSRKPPSWQSRAGQQWLAWVPGSAGEWQRALDGADGIVNLAGEPIAAKRWTAAQKDKLRRSRIDTTRALVDAIASANVKPKFLVSASAVGYYGARGDETLTESSAPGDDFLSGLCVEWEKEALRAEEHGVRVTLLRTGIVLGRGKGALAKMVFPFKLFLGGRLGSGKQWVPWIHIDDEVSLIQFLMENNKARGAFNATAPNPVTMSEFAKCLGKVLNRPAWAPVPASVLLLLLGEMAEMLLAGQRALPSAAQQLGFRFRYKQLTDALVSLDL